jgi:hypothetical protein
MPSAMTRVWPSLLALLLLALPASAEVYYVTLQNGSVLETKYQPQEASWDDSVVLLMTEVGNWIGVAKNEIASVRSDAENRGFGKVIGTNTVLLGWAANDAADPNAAAAAGGRQGDPALQAMSEAIQGLYDQRSAQQNYTVQQFVQPNQMQGIPTGLVGVGTGTPIGGTGGFPTGPDGGLGGGAAGGTGPIGPGVTPGPFAGPGSSPGPLAGPGANPGGIVAGPLSGPPPQ